MILFDYLKLGNYAIGLVEIALYCMFASFFLTKKPIDNSKKIGFLLTLGLALFGVLGLPLSPLRILIVHIIFFMCQLLLFRGHWLKRLLIVIGWFACIMVSDLLIIELFYRYYELYPKDSIQFKTYWILTGVAGKVISFMIIHMVYRLIKDRGRTLNFTVLATYLAPLISIYVIDLVIKCILTMPYLSVYDSFHIVAASIGLLISNVFTWNICNALIEKERQRQHYALYQEKIKSQYEYYRRQEKREEESRRLWHDIKNHIQCMHELIHQGHSDEAAQYLASLEQDITRLQGSIRTGHLIVDAILTEKYNRALYYQIKSVIKVDARNLDFIDDLHLCIIYSNLLDNAIEACEKVEKERREILITTKTENGFTVISVENANNGQIIKEDGKFITTKKDKCWHGIGLSNVTKVVQEYNGELKVIYNENYFKVKIILPYMA